MDNSQKFIDLREKYKTFLYNSFEIKEDEKEIYINFEFEIEGLKKFNPTIRILKKNMKIKNLNTDFVKKMVFHMGLIELISYWKATCSKNVIIKCGYINEEQISWFKKLYYYGLGELFYTNNIKVSIDEFMNIKCTGQENNSFAEESNLDGYIIPVGGGKDSIVTLEILKNMKRRALIVNPKPVTLKCAEIAGIENDNIIEVYRTIDKGIIELNSEGFINGHTPFSSMLAFLSYFIGYITGNKYIALSNESSANESNVEGEKINHQYSKTYEFENDFKQYTDKYLKTGVKYFSFLRPLTEIQIAKLVSKYEKYHKVFKSCNVGSKEKEWKWCCNCPKCLFVFTILSPFLYKDKLFNIFGEDLFEKKSLEKTFIELLGYGKTKPFECVGTYREVRYAASYVINKLEKENKKLPYLLEMYKDNYELSDLSYDITKEYNNENNLDEEQNELLRKEVFEDD